jgi:hypothetical protein
MRGNCREVVEKDSNLIQRGRWSPAFRLKEMSSSSVVSQFMPPEGGPQQRFEKGLSQQFPPPSGGSTTSALLFSEKKRSCPTSHSSVLILRSYLITGGGMGERMALAIEAGFHCAESSLSSM